MLKGFGNIHVSEAIEGALPKFQNSPQKVPFRLYAEQLTGSAFTVTRAANKWAWLYRMRPSVCHQPATFAGGHVSKTHFLNRRIQSDPVPPDNFRWAPLTKPLGDGPVDFIDGVATMVFNGAPAESGGSVSLYCFNSSMDTKRSGHHDGRYFSNNDAETLLIPQEGEIICKTEMGTFTIGPLEIGVIPRGVKFQVNLTASTSLARGYLCENFGSNFIIPDLGPIGSSTGLANPRHFLCPTAAYEELEGAFEIVTKSQGNLWTGSIPHSPLDVVAWYGNYVPYKYDLRLFCTINSVSFDHPDPSIYTVLTSPTAVPGKANIDFVIFPPRWIAMENTFRIPWFHRNVMSEFMGLVKGSYDAKAGSGFVPGGSSLHNSMNPHGPDAAAHEACCAADTTKPEKYKDTMGFMLESSLMWNPTTFAVNTDLREKDYPKCWQGLKKTFDRSEIPIHKIPLE